MYNDHSLEGKRRDLRKNLTDAEHLLWSRLRNNQLRGLKFRRQHSVGNYILDFYCSAKRLAIEIDGSQHMEQQQYDEERNTFLQSKDIHTLRFWNNEVIGNIDGVLEKITQELGI